MAQIENVAKIMEGDITVKLTRPLLYPMEWMMDVRLDCTGSAPSMTGLAGKAPDISISLTTHLALL